MYPLPDDFEPSILAGKTLVMVCFTSNTIVLELAPEIKITIVGVVAHLVDDEDLKWYEATTPPVQQSRLMQLTGQEITECTAEEDATLVLQFENGHVLRCEADSGPYEAYKLKIGSREIIV